MIIDNRIVLNLNLILHLYNGNEEMYILIDYLITGRIQGDVKGL